MEESLLVTVAAGLSCVYWQRVPAPSIVIFLTEACQTFEKLKVTSFQGWYLVPFRDFFRFLVSVSYFRAVDGILARRKHKTLKGDWTNLSPSRFKVDQSDVFYCHLSRVATGSRLPGGDACKHHRPVARRDAQRCSSIHLPAIITCLIMVTAARPG